MLRSTTPLDIETEEMVHRVIGYAIQVHRELGPGLLESIYVRAMAIELGEGGLSFECERQIPVLYKGRLLCRQRVDMIVENRILLEMKAVDRLAPVHQAQVLSYLRLSGLRIALLLNFNVAVLSDGLRRIVL